MSLHAGEGNRNDDKQNSEVTGTALKRATMASTRRKPCPFPDEFEEFKARACNGGTPLGYWYRSDPHEAALSRAVRTGSNRPRSHSLAPTLESRKRTAERFNMLCGPLKEMELSSGGTSSSKSPKSPLKSRAVSSQRRSTIHSCLEPEMDHLKPPAWSETLYRRRSFSTSSKGIVNEGDSIVLKSHDTGSNTNLTIEFPVDSDNRSRASSFNSGSVYSATSSGEYSNYRVLMVGSSGVGKTSLAQQFMTSEYMGAQSTSFDAGGDCTISILLDGEESMLEFQDESQAEGYHLDDPTCGDKCNYDAYVVIYSITSRHSFQRALATLDRLNEIGQKVAVILVANKSDLARCRAVREEEGRSLAERNDCKFIEVSAALNHKVDELLVGVLKQIRLMLAKGQQRRRKSKGQDSGDGKCVQKSRQTVLRKLFGSNRGMSKSCENLLTL